MRHYLDVTGMKGQMGGEGKRAKVGDRERKQEVTAEREGRVRPSKGKKKNRRRVGGERGTNSVWKSSVRNQVEKSQEMLSRNEGNFSMLKKST